LVAVLASNPAFKWNIRGYYTKKGLGEKKKENLG
jgi:hypothetical protein